VEHGRHYLGEAGDQCPFCQQPVPTDLIEQLDVYFDIRYTQQIDQLKGLQQRLKAWVDSWQAYFNDLLSKPGAADHLNIELLRAARIQLEQAMEQLTSTLATKLSGPSAIVDVVYPGAEVEAVNAVVDEANTSIKTFNLRLQNRTTEKKRLLDRCWVNFARQTLATEVGRFEGEMPALTKGRESLQSSIRLAEDRRWRFAFVNFRRR
jgi:wobble nucleotide-excising tRNase